MRTESGHGGSDAYTQCPWPSAHEVTEASCPRLGGAIAQELGGTNQRADPFSCLASSGPW